MPSIDDNDRKERRVQWERRAQSVMLSLVSAAIIWGVSTLASVDRAIAGLQPRIDSLDVQIAGAYRASEARLAVDGMTARITATEQRVERVDRRLDRVETAITASAVKARK